VAVVFRKQEISQNSTAGGGDPLPGAGRKRPGVGTQTMVPFNFSAVVAPLGKTGRNSN